MAGSITVTITGLNANELEGVDAGVGNRVAVLKRLCGIINGVANGAHSGTVEVVKSTSNAVRASGTATLSAVVATDSLTINGVAFACVNSGATGDQFNKGADDTGSATNLAAKINASTTAKVKGVVYASASGAVVTITSMLPGLGGNVFSLAQSGGHIALSPASALGSGTGGDAVPVVHSFA